MNQTFSPFSSPSLWPSLLPLPNYNDLPPPWVRAVSENPSTEQSCLAWKGTGKTNWPRLDLARGGLSSPRDLTRGGLSSPRDLTRGRLSSPRDLTRGRLSSPCDLVRGGGENALNMLTHSPRDSKWISSESMWLISVSRDWAKINQSSR